MGCPAKIIPLVTEKVAPTPVSPSEASLAVMLFRGQFSCAINTARDQRQRIRPESLEAARAALVDIERMLQQQDAELAALKLSVAQYEGALRHIAEHGAASRDWQFARSILGGMSIDDAIKAIQGA